jgi:hypothetical protein
MDDWACGIFVMLAMKLLIGGEQLSEATNDRVDETCHEALQLLLKETQLVSTTH